MENKSNLYIVGIVAIIAIIGMIIMVFNSSERTAITNNVDSFGHAIAGSYGTRTAICIDTDTPGNTLNTFNSYVYGIAKMTYDNITFYNQVADYCLDSNTLREGICATVDSTYWVDMFCPNGCSNGVCKSPIQNCIAGIKCYSNTMIGTLATNCVWMQTNTCQFGCSNGACKTAPTQNCTDTDNGINYYTKGTVTNTVSNTVLVFPDTCSTPTTLNEGSCKTDNIQAEIKITPYECPYGCSNGACKTAPTCIAGNKCYNTNTVRYQNTDCTWANTTTCTYVCSNGACITPCTAGWTCFDNQTRGYLTADCTRTNNVPCTHGCTNGICL